MTEPHHSMNYADTTIVILKQKMHIMLLLQSLYHQSQVFLITEQRPKKLLVFLNPNAGGGKSQSMYDEVTAPLFKLANIHTDVIGKLLCFCIKRDFETIHA